MNDGLRARFGDAIGERIGHGGEATVYAMSADRVLRVYHRPPVYLGGIAAFYDEIAGAAVPFALPRVIEHGTIDGLAYSVDARIPGRSLMDALLDLRGERRRRALDSYLDGAFAIASITIEPRPYFGEIVRSNPVRAATWREFLHARVDRSLVEMRPCLEADVSGFSDVLEEVHRSFDALPDCDAASLVHGDYFPGNVLIGDDDRVSGRVNGVIDFGPLTVVGDPMMDIASAIVFLEATREAYDPADAGYLTARLVAERGPAALVALHSYRAFYAIRLSNSKREGDEHLYGWCVASLRAMAPAP